MPTENGFSNQKKIGPSQYKTIHNVGSDKFAENAVTKGLVDRYSVAKAITAVLVSPDTTQILIEVVGHGAVRPGEVLRFITGPLATVELDIVDVISADILAVNNVMGALPVITNTVIVSYYRTPQLDSSGNIVTSSGPVQYLLNGVTTTVSEDTVTPGNSKPLPVVTLDGSGNVATPLTNTQLRASPVPVSATALPLPTGAATEAKQDTGNTSLATIAAKDFATSAKQDTGNTSLATIAAKDFSTSAKQDALAVLTGAVTETAPASDTASSGLNGRLQRIAQRLTSLIALFPVSIGQKTLAGSLSVAIASDQGAIAVTTATTDVVSSGTITAINQSVSIGPLNGVGTLTAQSVGTYTGALTLQGTIDGTNWVNITGVMNPTTGIISSTIASGAQSIYAINASGFNQLRFFAVGAMTGSVVVTLRGSRVAGSVGISSPLPAGSNVLGGVTQSGTWTVMPGNTANTTPWLMTTRNAAVTVKNAAISVGTTALRATTDNLAPSATRQKLMIMAEATNTGSIFLGASTVTSTSTTKGMILFPGQQNILENDANDYYLISDTAAQTVYIVECE